MSGKTNKIAIVILFLVFLFALGFAVIKCVLSPSFVAPPFSQLPIIPSKIEGIEKFSSEEEFKEYLQESQLSY